MLFFFFSSRRRHTRCLSDWSSDVCSSDLFGERDPRPVVSITARDVRCMMINLDPETGKQDGRVLKAVVRLNGNNAGVYGTVVQTGMIRIGQAVNLVREIV